MSPRRVARRTPRAIAVPCAAALLAACMVACSSPHQDSDASPTASASGDRTNPPVTATVTPTPPPIAAPLVRGPLEPVAITWAEGVDPGAAAGHTLNVPAGWTAEVWANVPHARLAAWAPDGRLAVSQADQGSLALVTPAGTRGIAASVATLATGLSAPQGLAFARSNGHDVLVVGESSRIVAWSYDAGSLADPRVVVDGLPTDGHGAKGLAIDGDVVYFSLGSSTNRGPSDRTADPQRAVIVRIGLDGAGYHVMATGVRNGFGLAMAPDGTLFTAVNQADKQPYPFRDDSGLYGKVVQEFVNENPVDQVTRIANGTELGWPYCMPDGTAGGTLVDIGYFPDPLLNPDAGTLDCTAIGRVQLGLPAHSAPLSLAFTTDTAAEQAIGEGALIGLHGSWNRTPPREPAVVFAPWDADTRSLLPAQPLVTGFQDADGGRWGRAVAAIPGPDGAIYVTDDLAGLVYRIAPPSAG